MDTHNTEQVMEEELEKMSGNLPDMGSDSDTDIEEDFTASYIKQENDLPDSVLTYFKFSRNRVNTFEQLILEDIADFETMRSETENPNQHADLFYELAFNSDEDPLQLKERIMSEIEEEVGAPCETYDSNGDNDTENDTYKDSERQFLLEWRRLEERLRKEEEERLNELRAEKKQRMKSNREEEQKMKCRSEQFRKELWGSEATNQFEYLEPVEGDGELSVLSLPVEMVKQQELIKRLEEQIEEERRVFEEVKQEEQKRLETRYITAATKLQAALRGMLVRRWSKKELDKRREEVKRRQEKRKEMEKRREREERMKMEWENERRRMEEEEQHHRKEAERRRVEYERAKQLERHRLESERKMEEQRRKEKEEAARRVEGEQKKMKEGRVEKEMRKIQEKKEIQEMEKSKIIDNEIIRKKEDELPEGIEERRAEEEKEKIQEGKFGKSKEEEKAQRSEVKLKIKDKEKSSERIKQKILEEVIRQGKVQEDEEKTKEKEDQNERKDEKTQKGMEDTRVDEEMKGKEVEEVQRKTQEQEKQKNMEIGSVKEEKSKVQVKNLNERKDVEKEKRTEDERHEKQKPKAEKKVEDEKNIKEKKGETSTEAEIKRKEKEENRNRMNEKRVVEKITFKEMERLKENETGQMQEEERKKLKQKDIEREEIVIKRNADEKATKWRKVVDNESQLSLSHSDSMSESVLARTLSSITGQNEQKCFPESSLHTLTAHKSSVTLSPSQEKSLIVNKELPCALVSSSSACLPDSSEKKRLAWMMNCTPWSKLSMQNKKKGLSIPPRRRRRRTALEQSLPPLALDTVLKSGSWSSLKQVTSVTLEDLSGCSLSTLSECTRLQSLTLRRCKLQALDGLNQCAELQHIDLEDNNISYVDCGGLTRLEVLLLGKNQLTSIHGLDNAVNLTVLQLSHNAISRISGLGSLKRLHRLTVDHNQLISTRGLGEAFTLLHLDCSHNHLNQVEGLENCALLNTLDLRGNNLTEIPVLENHVLLRELYLDDNSICSLHGLDTCWLPLLRCLSVSQNNITQLPPLVDLVSLNTLDISHNCLSDLRNICMSLQGCTNLQELSLVDNPVQEENNWRSSVLVVNPYLIKLNGEQTGASGKLFADSTQLWSFQALCQAHQDQIDSVLQRHCIEISSSLSTLQAQLLVGNHAAELFQLAEEQRYAHEYGDSGVCETARQDTVASSHQQKLYDGYLTQEKNAQKKTQHPAEHKTLPNFTNKGQSPSGDHHASCTGRSTQKIRDTQPSEDKCSRYGFQASRMNLRTVAVMVIQRRWREHRQRRNTRHLGTPAKTPVRLSPRREVESCTNRPEYLKKDTAATVIQAAWRGYTLRKRLTRALMLAQLSDGDEAFEEVDIDEFIFDEEAMEKDWSSLRPDMSPSSLLPYSEQLLLPKPLLPLQELHTSACVQLWKPRQAWIKSVKPPMSEKSQSPDSSTRMQSPDSTLGKYSFSTKSDKILEDWGISSDSTAYLMLKRAQRMKARKQRHQRILLAGRGDVSAQEALRGEPEHMQKSQRTYQWLQTRAMSSRKSSSPSMSDHFLPEIDPEILNGRRVQLVGSIGYREAPGSAVGIDDTGFSLPENHQTYTRARSAGYTKKDVLSPPRVTLAPSRKERMSFRDNPVQLSGGWGGGKKRSKTNKFK